MSLEKELFKLAAKIGTRTIDKIQIERHVMVDVVKYVIYHKDGHRWDISELEDLDDNLEMVTFYTFYEGWRGFDESGIEFAVEELRRIEAFAAIQDISTQS